MINISMSQNIKFCLLMVTAYFLLGKCCAEDSLSPEELQLSVTTNAGTVKGFQKKTIKGKYYLAFEGIPYAKPPVDDLRFAPPEKFGSWNGTLVGNKLYSCAQLMLIVHRLIKLGHEDCLYLNVYVPSERINKNANLSVIVYIHPGLFKMFSPKIAAGEIFIMDRDIIFVTFNYRLGVFGFLSTDDEIVPGNMGLKDQTMALKWVNENIDCFGGNPDSITLIGASAGGASVHYHYLSPLSRGLFHRGMSQSGIALHSWALTKNPRENLMELTNRLNCSQHSSKVMVDCLRKLSRNSILDAVKDMHVILNLYPFQSFGPVVEKGPDAFLPDHPYKLLSTGDFMQVPWLTSNTIDEGVPVFQPLVTLKKLRVLEEKWDKVLPDMLYYTSTANKTDWQGISRKLRQYYLGNKPATEALNELIELAGDRVFFYDGYNGIKLHTLNSEAPVYYYRYSFNDGETMWGIKGVAHGDDTKIVFKVEYVPKNLPHEVAATKDVLLDMIYSYATKGVPEINGRKFPVFVGTSEGLIINIYSANNTVVETMGEFKSQKFWDELPIMENQKLFS